MPKIPDNENGRTIRLSLRWVTLAVALLFGIGILGGLAGQQLLAPPLPPLTANDRLVTQVQEVTISPNTAAAEVVASVERSVVLLGRPVGTTIEPLGSAAVVTNDGLLASTIVVGSGDIVALDDTGAATMLDRVGTDTLYGISYWRIPVAVVVPLDLRREPVGVGSELLAVSRSETTRRIKVVEYRAHELSVPRPDDAPGIQQLLKGTDRLPSLFVGAPLVDDEGRLAGLILDADGHVVGSQMLQLSLNRLARGERELDQLTNLGLDLEFSFAPLPENPGTVSFAPRVVAVTPNSPAANARLQRGDIIVAVNDEPVSWERNVVEQLSAALPLKVTVQRGEVTIPVSVTNVAQSE